MIHQRDQFLGCDIWNRANVLLVIEELQIFQFIQLKLEYSLSWPPVMLTKDSYTMED